MFQTKKLLLGVLLVLLAASQVLAGPGTVSINPIPDQLDEELFTISVAVRDDQGRPVSKAAVSVSLDPTNSQPRALGHRFPVHLRDAARIRVDHLDAVTGDDGIATVWLRLGCNYSPYPMRLVVVGPSGPVSSNTFTLNSRDTFDEDK